LAVGHKHAAARLHHDANRHHLFAAHVLGLDPIEAPLVEPDAVRAEAWSGGVVERRKS